MANEMDEMSGFITRSIEEWREGIELIEKLFKVAEPGAIFSEPVSVEGHTVITASEISVGLGFGHGVGGGSGPPDEGTAEGTPETASGFGGGGGGGGGAMGRPVATIIIDERGVRVEPVVDATKIALAFFTTLGSIFLMVSKMWGAARG